MDVLLNDLRTCVELSKALFFCVLPPVLNHLLGPQCPLGPSLAGDMPFPACSTSGFGGVLLWGRGVDLPTN